MSDSQWTDPTHSRIVEGTGWSAQVGQLYRKTPYHTVAEGPI